MKIEFYPVSEATPENIEDNRRLSLARNLPLHTDKPVYDKNLAVVGSGPSAASFLRELQSFNGDVWGINGAVSWLYDHGIDAVMFSACQTKDWTNVDPAVFKRVRRAMLSWYAAPEIFDLLPADCDITIAKIVSAGSTSATAVPLIAAEMGYRSVTFYGCESCFGSRSHIDREEHQPSAMVVKCGGSLFLTNAQMLMQSYELGGIIKGCPGYLFEKSGGLLRARMSDDNYDVLALSDEMSKRLNISNDDLHANGPRDAAAA